MRQSFSLVDEETSRSCEECYYHGLTNGRLWCTLDSQWIDDDSKAENCIDFEPLSEHPSGDDLAHEEALRRMEVTG